MTLKFSIKLFLIYYVSYKIVQDPSYNLSIFILLKFQTNFKFLININIINELENIKS